jgi:hypothetical protein
VNELAAQGAKAVALDVIFGELRPDHAPVQMMDGSLPESDDFFATAMHRASNVVLAVSKDLSSPKLFLTNALAVADISTDKDSDGILRKVKVFRIYRDWHWAFRQLEADPDFGINLHQAQVTKRQIVLPRLPSHKDLDPIVVPLDEKGNFDLADFGGENLPPGVPRKALPFIDEKFWHMGVTLAALELGLDLASAQVDLPHRRIVLTGAKGVRRVIPGRCGGLFLCRLESASGQPSVAA